MKNASSTAVQLFAMSLARVASFFMLQIQDVIDVLKIAFVDLAVISLKKSGEKVNVSRISALTGVHRKDVVKLLGSAHVPEATESRNLLHRVLTQWAYDKRFSNGRGSPKVLADPTVADDFKKLVHSISQDLHPGTILFELERRQLVERTSRGIKMNTVSQLEQTDAVQAHRYLAEDVDDLTSVVLANVDPANSEKLPHAKTEFDNISDADLPEIRVWLKKECDDLHQRARDYLSKFDRDVTNEQISIHADSRNRVALGAFALVTPTLPITNKKDLE